MRYGTSTRTITSAHLSKHVADDLMMTGDFFGRLKRSTHCCCHCRHHHHHDQDHHHHYYYYYYDLPRLLFVVQVPVAAACNIVLSLNLVTKRVCVMATCIKYQLLLAWRLHDDSDDVGYQPSWISDTYLHTYTYICIYIYSFRYFN